MLNAGLAAHKLSGRLAPFAFHGEAGIDALVLNDQSAAAPGAFSIDAATSSFGAGAAVFDATLENARVFAGTAANAFVVVDAPVLTGILNLDGGPGVNKLTGADSSNIWKLGANAGTPNGSIAFDKFATLTAGQGTIALSFPKAKRSAAQSAAAPGRICWIAPRLQPGSSSICSRAMPPLRGAGSVSSNITTAHDGTPSALIALLSEWNGSHDYATRTANFLGHTQLRTALVRLA